LTCWILGISCYYHDSAASLIKDGEIISAVQEERFTRKKHDSSFPYHSIKYCLETNKINLKDIKSIIYYEKPLLTFERLLETYLSTAPRGSRSFISAMQVWIKEKLFLKSNLKKELKALQKEIVNDENPYIPKILYSEHHLSHAAAAFYPSPFNKAAILCMDGVGEWATTSAWIGESNNIKPLWEINFPHSLGLLYSSFTYYCGFKVNSGEYKLMGLAPYGKPIFANKIKENIIDIKEDGSFKLNLKYFKYHRGFRMTSRKFHQLFGENPRKTNSELTQFHMNLAASIQLVTEEIVLKLSKSLRKETGIRNICLAGGVALNCVANGKLLRGKIFDNIWIQPASGDAGSSLGAALLAYYQHFQKPRSINPLDSMKGSYLGCNYSNEEIINYLEKIKAPYYKLNDQNLFDKVASLLDKGNVIGWFNGPMEFGPRALGGRSIIGDARNHQIQSIMNLKIKYRESFRPFAPSVLEEDVSSQFELKEKSPYMLLVASLKKELCKEMNIDEEKLFGIEKLKVIRSSLPSITHVDYSARVQTVSPTTNKRYYELINTFKKKTGCPTIVNTSFNVRGEPIVRTPQDAYRCFMRTDMDILVLENQLLIKNEQPKTSINENWKQEFTLD
jgi:carbamoyltransferase